MTQLIELDGAVGEGGGQILRTSLSLSLITGRPFRLRNIRAGRPRPGLRPQHLTSVQAAAAIGQATVRGACVDSTDITFEPGKVVPGKYHFPIGTAGATSLVLHTIYLPLALAGGGPSELTLEGGTHVSTSPCFDFLKTTWLPYTELCGLHIDLRLHRRGFYPRGGGLIQATIQPCIGLHGLQLTERSPVRTASCLSAVASLPDHIAKRQSERAHERLEKSGLHVTMHHETWPGGPGTLLGVTLDAAPVPVFFFGLGERGKSAERVADEAVDQALAYVDAAPAAVDAHSADQLVLPLALADGPSAFSVAEITPHLTTNVAVIRRFLEREIVVEGKEGRSGWVRIR